MIDGWVRTDTVKRDKWRLRRLRKIKFRTILLVFLIFAILSLILLRVNNMNMADLRRDVYTADKTGQMTEVKRAASILQNYVSSHMNTDTGLISLQTMYNNAVAEAVKAANTDIDSSVYMQADQNCRNIAWQQGYSAYVQCVANAIGGTTLNKPKLPDPSLFYLSFSAPLLSADLAGVTVVITILLFIMLLIRASTEVILAVVVRIKKRNS